MPHFSSSFSAKKIVEKVRQAGVVGAGGGGFPAHVKLNASVDFFIANAAECEPLLCKDQELMKLHAQRMVHGLRLGMKATGASRGVIAIKKKYKQAIAQLEKYVSGNIDFYLYDNFYPAGDEFIIVYDVLGRLIPPGGIPLDVGCVVNNVETLINISCAMEDAPVTHSALTVAGAVHEPLSVVAPLGTPLRELLALAGGATVDDPVFLDGGAMMGKPLDDLDTPVTKTSAGYIVIPRDHHLYRRKTRSSEVNVHISRSACDQCSYCTELCPRYLLGYAIEPHAVMRSVGFEGDKEAHWARLGLLCCECSICDLYACPEDLPVKDMQIRSKTIWNARGWPKEHLIGLDRVHPMRDSRRVPIPRLIQRLGLTDWDVSAPITSKVLEPMNVQLMLKQHAGAPAVPVVGEGEVVKVGQLVAAIPSEQLGANIHASIDGYVARIDDNSIWLTR